MLIIFLRINLHGIFIRNWTQDLIYAVFCSTPWAITNVAHCVGTSSKKSSKKYEKNEFEFFWCRSMFSVLMRWAGVGQTLLWPYFGVLLMYYFFIIRLLCRVYYIRWQVTLCPIQPIARVRVPVNQVEPVAIALSIKSYITIHNNSKFLSSLLAQKFKPMTYQISAFANLVQTYILEYMLGLDLYAVSCGSSYR